MTRATPARALAVSVALLAVALVALAAGLVWGVAPLDLGNALFGPADGNTDRLILLEHRLPRALIAASVGASLSAAGAAFQALTRNALADPYVLGVSGGAALGGTLVLCLGLAAGTLGGMSLLTLGSFGGALAALLLVYGLASGRGRLGSYGVLLLGVVFNAFASAVIMFLKTVVSAQKAQEMLFWLMGTLTLERVHSAEVALTAGSAISGVAALLALAPSLNVLALGEEGASSRGVDPVRLRRGVFIACSLMVGASVSVTGMIGFVGLIVPHAARLALGPDNRLLLPASALGGAAFLLLADLAARLLFPLLTTEAPVGVITAFVGGPLFVLLLRRSAAASSGEVLH